MTLENNEYYANSDVEFLFERPIGWSSACLDSTINYYLECNHENIQLEDSATKVEPNN